MMSRGSWLLLAAPALSFVVPQRRCLGVPHMESMDPKAFKNMSQEALEKMLASYRKITSEADLPGLRSEEELEREMYEVEMARRETLANQGPRWELYSVDFDDEGKRIFRWTYEQGYKTPFGWNYTAEIWNSRLAMIGFVYVLIMELVEGKGVITQMQTATSWEELLLPVILPAAVYFAGVLAVTFKILAVTIDEAQDFGSNNDKLSVKRAIEYIQNVKPFDGELTRLP